MITAMVVWVVLATGEIGHGECMPHKEAEQVLFIIEARGPPKGVYYSITECGCSGRIS
jgi:hypothetical protein